MREKIHVAVRTANRYYLERVLERNRPERHEQIRSMFDQHMTLIADYCMDGYGGRGTLTTAFIRGLHKSLFPRDYRQTITMPQGEVTSMVPGEYKTLANHAESYVHPGRVYVFIAPADVAETMEGAVSRVNAALVSCKNARIKRDAILLFLRDFSIIHPFADANGRMAYILTDLLLIKEGLAPIHFGVIKEKDLPALYRAEDMSKEMRDLAPLYEVIERYNPAALADRA